MTCPACHQPVSPEEDQCTNASEENPIPTIAYHAGCTTWAVLAELQN